MPGRSLSFARTLPLFGLLCAALFAPSPGLAEPGNLAGAGAGKPYTVTVEKVAAKKGQPAIAQVVIRPATGYHVNKEFPASLKLKPPPGVTVAKADLSKQDATITETEGSFKVSLTSAEAGKKSVPGDLRFAVCTDTTCDPQKTTVSIEMEVK